MAKASLVMARRRVAAGYAQALEDDLAPANPRKTDGARSAPRLKATKKAPKPAKSKSAAPRAP